MQIDPNVILKIHATRAHKTEHVIFMAVIVGELFYEVDGFDWVKLYKVMASGVLKPRPYKAEHGCLMIPFDRNHNLVAVLNIDLDQLVFSAGN